MTNEIRHKEESLEDLANDPVIKIFRERELNKTSHQLFNRSAIGKVSSVAYVIVGFGSIFVYWQVLNCNIFLSVFLGIVTWFVITLVFDKIFIKFFGLEELVKQESERNIKASMENLKKRGLLK